MQPHHRLALWLAAAAAVLLAVGAVPQPSSKCQRKCGEVDIPFPFGIGPDDCALPGFILRCDNTSGGGGPYVSFPPYVRHVDVVNISLLQGQAQMISRISSACYNTSSQEMDYVHWILEFTNTPYRFSNTRNRFTVIGCYTQAYIQDLGNKGYASGCLAVCKESDVASLSDDGSCSGIGCCQTAIPKGLQSYIPMFDRRFNTSQIYNFSACSYAVLMDSSDFNFQMSYVTSRQFNSSNNKGKQPLAIDWAIGNETCEVAKMKKDSYACVSTNSYCVNSSNGPGYICNCSQGYEGNPYLYEGCKGNCPVNSFYNIIHPN